MDILNFRKRIAAIYVSSCFVILPLFFYDKYFNISREKWLCFMVLSITLFLCILGSFIFDKGDWNINGCFSLKNITDCAFLFFIVVNLISTVFSDYTSYCIFGHIIARYNGLTNLIFYFLIYIIIRQYVTDGKGPANLFVAVGSIVNIFALCQYFTLDLFYMYKEASDRSVEIMLSPIGNRITYSGYLSILFGLTLVRFLQSKKTGAGLYYIVATALIFAGGYASNSDCFYLGIAGAVIITVFAGGLVINDLYRICLSLMMGSGALMVMSYAGSTLKSRGLAIRSSEGFTLYLESNPLFCVKIFVISVILTVLAYIIGRLRDKNAPLLSGLSLKIFRITVTAAAVALIIKLALMFPFDNQMGNKRGFIWNIAIKDFIGMNLYNKLFGYGPETIYEIYKTKYHNDFVTVAGKFFDNVHCEPLQYLVTSGIFGLAAYLMLLISLGIKLIKLENYDKESSLYLAPICAYFLQSTVNIAQSATTPLYFVIIALAAGYIRSREAKKENTLKCSPENML